MNKTIDFNRIKRLLQRFFVENKNRELYFWSIATLVMIVVHNAPALIMYLILSGVFFTSRIFKIFAHTPQSMHYLLIPATHAEKLIVVILLNSVYYLGMFLLTYVLGSVIGIPISNMIFGTNTPIYFELFQSYPAGINLLTVNSVFKLLSVIYGFVLVQSVFLTGALYFRRNAVAGTILMLFLVVLALSLFHALIGKLYGSHLQSAGDSISNYNNIITYRYYESPFTLALEIGWNIIKILAIPYFWTVSYFRLTEKEL